MTSAIAPVPFTAPSMTLRSKTRTAEAAAQPARPVETQQTKVPKASSAVLSLALGDLGEKKLIALLKAQPDARVTIELGAKTALALLKCIDTLNDDARVPAPESVAAATQKHMMVADPEPENDTLARDA